MHQTGGSFYIFPGLPLILKGKSCRIDPRKREEREGMLYPIIDIGSNTVKLAVLDEEKYFSSTPVFFKAVPLNLKTKVENGRLPQEAAQELADLIREFCAISKRLTPQKPLAFATASLRGLENQKEVLNFILRESGVAVDPISGETEAYYAFLGALGKRRLPSGITVDLGGGSTEILAFRKGKVVESVSLPMGCLTLYEKYFKDGQNRILACREEIRDLLRGAPDFAGSAVLFSGGSAKALLRYKNMLEKRKNTSLSRREMEKVLWHFDHASPEDKAGIEEVLRDRYRLVPPAVAVFTEILRHYRKERAAVCRSGVREGRLKAYLMNKS